MSVRFGPFLELASQQVCKCSLPKFIVLAVAVLICFVKAFMNLNSSTYSGLASNRIISVF
jgi:hypothetical protein